MISDSEFRVYGLQLKVYDLWIVYGLGLKAEGSGSCVGGLGLKAQDFQA